jgi:hypothetical protein
MMTCMIIELLPLGLRGVLVAAVTAMLHWIFR